jgi:hypothetical protein
VSPPCQPSDNPYPLTFPAARQFPRRSPRATPALRGDVNGLAVVGDTILAGVPSGAFASADDGRTWLPVNDGISNTALGSVATEGGYLFASV